MKNPLKMAPKSIPTPLNIDKNGALGAFFGAFLGHLWRRWGARSVPGRSGSFAAYQKSTVWPKRSPQGSIVDAERPPTPKETADFKHGG